MTLALLCMAALALSAVAVSALVAVLLPGLDRALGALAPARQPVAWLLVMALPALASVLFIGAALLPSAGVGLDHCLGHAPSHPHLCVHHPQTAPGAALLFLAGFLAARLALAMIATLRNAVRVRVARRALLASTVDELDGVHIIDHPTPHAFALGGARPGIYLSRSLLALGADLIEPVLAHERAHLRRGHLAMRTVASLVGAFHLPGVTHTLMRRLARAQEMAADADAAGQLGDGVRVAEALLALARLRVAAVPASLSFAHGDLTARVHALLDPPAPRSGPALALASLAALCLGALCAVPQTIHHALETALGALS